MLCKPLLGLFGMRVPHVPTSGRHSVFNPYDSLIGGNRIKDKSVLDGSHLSGEHHNVLGLEVVVKCFDSLLMRSCLLEENRCLFGSSIARYRTPRRKYLPKFNPILASDLSP